MHKIFTRYYYFIKTRKHLKKTSRGFTLIELLTVMGIIGLLASVILTNLTIARMRARDSMRKSNMQQLELAVQLYYDTNGAYPPGDNTQGGDWSPSFRVLMAPYLKPIPLDPSGSSVRYYATGLMTWAPDPDPEHCNGKYVVWMYLESKNDPDYGKQTCNFGGAHYFRIVDHP